MQLNKKVQIVITKGNSVLLLRTTKKRKSFWQNITGSIEKDESFAAAAMREVHEETGLQHIDLLQLPPVFKFVDQWGKNSLEKSFLGIVQDKNVTILLDPQEHDLYQWHPLSEIKPSHYFYDSNYQVFKAALSRLKNKEGGGP